MTLATSGTGSNASSTISALRGRLVAPNASTAGYATRGFTTGYNSTTANVDSSYDGLCAIGSGIYSGNWSGEGTIARVIYGRRVASGIPVPTFTVAEKSFGFEIEFKTGGGELRVFAHDGTTLSTSVASFTPTNFRTFKAVAVSDSGTVKLYVNGTEVASTTGGPTGTDDNLASAQWEIINDSTATINNRDFFFDNPKLMLPFN
jgi:hypothetical protein